MNKRKICFITGSRAEFGIMQWLMKDASEDDRIDLQIIVTGMHLSSEFGFTYKEIEKMGLKINKKIEILLSSDTPVGISKSMGLAMISFSEALSELRPDICVVLGDRFEIFSAVSAAMVSQIPIAHIHGGESTEGVIDEAIRHSITKMSHLHFVAADQYKKRVTQLGESPQKVFNFGAPSLDNIERLKLIKKEKLELDLNFKFSKLTFLVTFHPVTLEKNTSQEHFQNLLDVLELLEDVKIIFTLPNSDTFGRDIIELISDFVNRNPVKYVMFKSLGQLNYLSCLKYVSLVIGNSSSGLIEVPSFKIPTINIGDRQNGRLKSDSVIDCNPNKNEIKKAINLALSSNFKRKISKQKNLYGSPGASKKILDELINHNLRNILKKKFYSL